MATPRRTKITIALLAAVVISAAVLIGGLWAQKAYREYLFLYEVVDSSDGERVHAFLKQGVNVNARGYWKETALIHAAQNHRSEVARILLDAGADVNAQDETGDTALLYALKFFPMNQPNRWSEAIATVKLLLHAGARVDLASANGESARQWAEQRASTLKKNSNLYASFRKAGRADPTQTLKDLTAMVLAEGKRTP